ncbi:MAG: DUF1810 family protein [Ruminococcus sp.]|nr:DUF1810 family protein [Ruminococcus sp.]
MLHNMKLKDEPFAMIEDGRKTIELRLNDEKRRKVQPGDFICFTHITQPERMIQVRVTALHPFPGFRELFEALPAEKCGFAPGETVPDGYMDSFYPVEEQKRYGVLGIEFRRTDLQRFIDAQEQGYEDAAAYSTAIDEIRAGEKNEHWMWYVFPQIKGLSTDPVTEYFALNGITEARDYLEHLLLGSRLREAASELMKLDTDDPVAVFGLIDAYKLRRCMTLFAHIAKDEELFLYVLDKYCMGSFDDDTIALI